MLDRHQFSGSLKRRHCALAHHARHMPRYAPSMSRANCASSISSEERIRARSEPRNSLKHAAFEAAATARRT